MAHHKSAKKRIRRNERRRDINRARVGTIRTHLKRVEIALGDGDKDAAQSAFRDAQPHLMRGVTKGVVERNTMRRTLSRLSARIKALQAT
jgi:small subunit ribosomal protein S20